MRAFQFSDPATGLQLHDVPIPEPGPGQVLIAVKAAGLCHSDCHVLRGGGGAWMRKRPITLGHEVSGTVAALGPPASPEDVVEADGGEEEATEVFEVGDRVAIALQGHPIERRDFAQAPGVGYDGGYAAFALAHRTHLVRVPAGVSFAQAAVATDSIATAYHAVVAEGQVKAGTTVAVIGLGGLGLNGVAIAALLGARVYGVDVAAAKFDQARVFGAAACATALDDFPDVVFDVVVDFAGAGVTTAKAIEAVKLGGCVVLVGLGAATTTFVNAALVTRGVQLRGLVGASADELKTVLQLIQEGKLAPSVQEIAFEDVPNGLKLLEESEVQGRLYTVPS